MAAMTSPFAQTEARTRLLDPIEQTSEVWFGLIMVLTLTCSLSVAEAGSADVRQMLIDALGCNLAWGIIDAFMYLAASFSEHGRIIAARQALLAARNSEESRTVLREVVPPALNQVLTAEEVASLTARINQLPPPPRTPRLTRDDWMGSLATFLLVVLSALPVSLPFIFIQEPLRALRTSNGIAIALLFVTGYKFGQYSGYRPWLMGGVVTLFAVALVAVTMRLGG
jgi:VIT1/CCC1 family predicted Fe2+/Mn2+ transporter